MGLPASVYLGRRALGTHSPEQLTLEPPGLWPSSGYLLAVRGAGGLRWPRSQGRPEGGLLRPLPGHGPLLWVLVAVVEVPGHRSGSLLADVLLPAGLLPGGEQILHGSVGEGPGGRKRSAACVCTAAASSPGIRAANEGCVAEALLGCSELWGAVCRP